MTLRGWSVLSAALLLAACGPAGSLAGKVTVEGGSAANLVVFIYGPESKATVTADDGSFTAGALPDGTYLVRVVVKGAEVEEQTAPGTIKNGKSAGDVALAFKFSTGKVTGHLAFSDGSDAAGLPVTLTGAVTRGGTTAVGGAFSFEGLPPGGYVVAAEAGSTLEGRLAVSAAVTGAVDVGELRFTALGRVAGAVTANALPVAGAAVAVAGTTVSAVTDAMGHFELLGVPAGARTVTARTLVPPRVASAAATIARGPNPDLALSLVEETRRGTVTGAVTFVGQQSPKIITLSAPGTAATTQPGADGAYNLSLPIGDWDVVATAPLYPKKTLGHVHVVEGQTVTLPGDTLSWYEPIWTGPAPLSALSMVTAPAAGGPWYAAVVYDLGAGRALLINRLTRDVRVLAAGVPGSMVFSRQGRFVAFTLSNQLFTYDLTTGDLKAWGITGAGNNPAAVFFGFSTDESVLFVARYTSTAPAGYYLERIAPGSGQVARFPATGVTSAAPSRTGSPDRWLVRLNTNDVTLVTPTADFPQLFTGVSAVYSSPMLMALTNCGASCTLKVVGPTATAALTVAGTFPTSGVGFQPVAATADYAMIYWGPLPVTYAMLRSSDATLFPLPAISAAFFNSPGTRYSYSTVAGGVTSIFEDALPPSAALTPVAQVTGPPRSAYLSPTRLIVVDPAAPRYVDVKSGVATIGTDVAPSALYILASGCFAWQAGAASGSWKFMIGDRATVTTDVPATTPGVSFAARGGDPTTDFCAVSFDNASAVVVDGAQGTFRRSMAGWAYNDSGERWGSLDVFQVVRPYANAYVSFATDQLVEPYEPGFVSTLLSYRGAVDRAQFALKDRTLYLAFPR